MIYKTEILKNQIPLDVLSSIKDELDSLTNQDIVFRAFTCDYYTLSDDTVKKITELLPLMPNETPIIVGAKLNIPTGLHTDANPYYADGFDAHSYARTFVIPLETLDTTTILFEQVMPRGVLGNQIVHFIKQLPDINAITDADIETYFKSLAQEYWINKLSIHEVFPWIAGDVLTFDVYRIHTGDCHPRVMNKNFIFIWTVTQ